MINSNKISAKTGINPWLAISLIGLSTQTLLRQLIRPHFTVDSETVYLILASLPNFLCAGVIVPFLFLIFREFFKSSSESVNRNNLHLWFFLCLPISAATIIVYENASMSAIFFNTTDFNDVLATYMGSGFAILVYILTLKLHPAFAK